MSNLDNIQRRISEGVSGWLLFEFNCLRGPVFNEKYLSYPISQILNSNHDLKTLTEINHPDGNKSQGRPLQVDFVLQNRASLQWQLAIESKWIGNSKISLADVIWDLIRLQNLFKHYKGIKSYFILSGFNKKINEFLSDFDILYNPASTKSNLFVNINQTYLKFNLNKLDQATKDKLNKKLVKYPNFRVYSRILCIPAHVAPRKDTVNMTFATYIFEVLAPDETLKVSKL